MRITDEAGRIIACPCCGEDTWCVEEVAAAVDGLDQLPVVVMPAPRRRAEQGRAAL